MITFLLSSEEKLGASMTLSYIKYMVSEFSETRKKHWTLENSSLSVNTIEK